MLVNDRENATLEEAVRAIRHRTGEGPAARTGAGLTCTVSRPRGIDILLAAPPAAPRRPPAPHHPPTRYYGRAPAPHNPPTLTTNKKNTFPITRFSTNLFNSNTSAVLDLRENSTHHQIIIRIIDNHL
ncbi:unnamed protein product [Chrysodeixis includens]|uniref:Uncharacterized protein n=1 Tax=Chrysodeixis includens TaxID=689277 RepID=A0A9N8Q0N2_CHRIL|nr:unnamed protein product [Chrysodeixis includens]